MPAALSATRRRPSSSNSAARSPTYSRRRRGARTRPWRRARGAQGHAAIGRPAHTNEAKASAQRASARVQAALPHLLLLLQQRTAPRLAARQQTQLQYFCPQREDRQHHHKRNVAGAATAFGAATGSKGTNDGHRWRRRHSRSGHEPDRRSRRAPSSPHMPRG